MSILKPVAMSEPQALNAKIQGAYQEILLTYIGHLINMSEIFMDGRTRISTERDNTLSIIQQRQKLIQSIF